MALCGLPWCRRRRTVPEASLAPGNGGGAQLVQALAAALPSHPVASGAVYSAAVCMCVKALQTSLLAYRSSCSRDRVEIPAMFSLLQTALQV